MAVELTCDRTSWRILAPLGTTAMADPRSARGAPSARTSVVLALLATAFVLVPAALVVQEVATSPDPAWGTLALVPVALLVVASAALTAHALGSSWWHYGAGRPVLVVDGDRVRGRLHSARRSGPAYDGWDFDISRQEVVAVRLTEPGHLAISLPDPLTRELLEHPHTRVHARQWRAVTGCPASWPASRMLAARHRDERLEQLISALSPTPSAGAGT